MRNLLIKERGLIEIYAAFIMYFNVSFTFQIPKEEGGNLISNNLN